MKCRAECWSVILVLGLAQHANVAGGEDKLVQEAKALFRVINAERVFSEKCSLRNTWSPATLPEELARKYFGTKLHGDIAPPYSGTPPADIFDLPAKFSFAICNGVEAKFESENRMNDFKLSSETILQSQSISYTFPIFNENLQKAAIIVSEDGSAWFKGSNGIRREIGVRSDALIFKKSNGKWSKIATVELGAN